MRRVFLLSVLCLALCARAVWAESPILKLSDVRPGMKGVMRTVFEGTRREDVPIEVVDVVRRIAPGRDVIIIRLLGEKINRTGVARGMSGSPIYIDG